MINFLNNYKRFFLGLIIPLKNFIFFYEGSGYVFSNSEAFKETLTLNKGSLIKEIFSDFLKKQKIRSDLFIIEYPHAMCFSVGSNFYLTSKSHAAIFFSKGFYDLDALSFSFIFKHEISHIKNSDVWMTTILSLFVSLFLTVPFYFLFSYSIIKAACLSLLFLIPINVYVTNKWLFVREKKADLFAAKHSTLEELKGGVRYFLAIKKFNSALSDKFPALYSKEGECITDKCHPTTQSRINLLNGLIKSQTGFEYNPSENELNSLVELLKDNDEAHIAILKKISEPQKV